ncbi:hypothetical protein [Bradyrhizobium sacchari]|uniref:hypothetical protein n=1 Tax=Bradyrhizobium sacchari TaxID=1399419 RepID=UPI00142EC817
MNAIMVLTICSLGCVAKCSHSTFPNCLDLRGHASGADDLRTGGNIELDFARQLDDGLRMMAIRAQCVFERMGTVHEDAAKNAILFADNPVAATISANKDARRCGAARRRFDKLHDQHPSISLNGMFLSRRLLNPYRS